MLPQPTMVLDDTVLVGMMIEDMGIDGVRQSVLMMEIQARRKERAAEANDKTQSIEAAFDPLSPAKSQTCVKKSKKIELGTRSSEKNKKKGELGTRSSARLQA
ncbi:hypothetical protein AMTRI_Chr09g35680 [Amborella trichopoda]